MANRFAFNLLWSVTDKIFEHVTDIRNLLNTTTVPVAGSLSDDPPSYESSTSEHLIDQLKGKINYLEDLDKQRKLLYDQYADKLNECNQVKSVHSEEKQLVLDRNVESTYPDAATTRDDFIKVLNNQCEFTNADASTPKDVAIKTLRSFIRTRQAAVKAHRLLWIQIREGCSSQCSSQCPSQCSYQYVQSRSVSQCHEEEKKFLAKLRLMGLFISQLVEDHCSLLRDGKMLEEKILSVSRDRGEETSKFMKRVRDSYRQVEEIVVPTFFDLLLPILKNLLSYRSSSEKLPTRSISPSLDSRRKDANGTSTKVKPVFQPVVSILKSVNKRYMKVVEAYQDALQDLADLVVP